MGGKTGTAHIAKNGRYVREYHSSFYGFANDKEGHKYTIGVLVIRAKKYRHYFASKSAVPTFRRTLDILVELDYLKPEGVAEVSPEIVIDKPKAPVAKVIPKPIQEKVQKSVPKSTVNDLFKTKPSTPKVEKSLPPKQTVTPPKDKSVNELFEDLF